MTCYTCTDGNFDIEIEADSPEEAAQEYVDGGDWGEYLETTWINICVTDEEGYTQIIKVTLEPEEPPCQDDEHDWRSPHEIVGGIEDNPGVWGNQGGVLILEVCVKCGCGRTTDTWAQDPEDGEQGLTSVAYEPDRYDV